MQHYVNCPKCNTYQPFGKGVCQICGASLDQPDPQNVTNFTPAPPAPEIPIMGVGGPAYVPPVEMSIEDYINQHKQEVAQQQEEEDQEPEPEGEGIPVYALVGQEIVDLIINLPWFDDECFLAQPMNKNQEWATNHYFVPLSRMDELYGSVEG